MTDLGSIARRLFQLALRDGREGELLGCLFDGGTATIDPAGRLVMLPAEFVQMALNPVTEFSVHDQEGFAPVYDVDETIGIRRGALRALLDVAVGSMDWGSGFLDNEQVEILREVAGLVGVDPVTVTPTNFTCMYNFEGVHDWRTSVGNPQHNLPPLRETPVIEREPMTLAEIPAPVWPTPNRFMFDRIAQHIEDHPEEYDQEEWDSQGCGMVCCVGGWAVVFASTEEQRASVRRQMAEDPYTSYLGGLAERLGFTFIAEAAQHVLGLAETEAGTLFAFRWRAAGGDVPAALRAIGSGVPVMDVTNWWTE